MSIYDYKFHTGERVRLTMPLTWSSGSSPRVGDVGAIVKPGIIYQRVDFGLEKGVVEVSTRKLAREGTE